MKTEKLRRWFFRTDKHANNHVNNKVLVDCTNYQSCANVPSAIYQTKKKRNVFAQMYQTTKGIMHKNKTGSIQLLLSVVLAGTCSETSVQWGVLSRKD